MKKTLKEIEKKVKIEVEKLTISELLKINLVDYRKELTKKFLNKNK